jgi:peptidoglycan/LPS O-acetylase OafA/YrhL
MLTVQDHKERVFGLDIFRAAAILLVVLLHGRVVLDGTAYDRFPDIKIIDGVALFFVLSGFLIGGILLRIINSGEPFTLAKLLRFWKRRWFRTLPLYYLILAINYVVVRANIIHEGIHNFNWRYFFFLQNFTKPFVGFFRESWSLTVEEWFYVTTPIMLFVLFRFFKPKLAFIIVTVVMLAFSFVCRSILMDTSFDRFWLDLSIRKVVVARLDSIGYGLLAAWLYYYYRAYWDRYRTYAFVIGIVLVGLLFGYTAPVSSFYRQVVYFSLYPLAMMLWLPLASSIRSGSGLIAKAITHISIVSYSIYLVHFSLVAEVIRDSYHPADTRDAIVKYIGYWVIVLIASTGLYYGFERPVMNLRDKV